MPNSIVTRRPRSWRPETTSRPRPPITRPTLPVPDERPEHGEREPEQAEAERQEEHDQDQCDEHGDAGKHIAVMRMTPAPFSTGVSEYLAPGCELS